VATWGLARMSGVQTPARPAVVVTGASSGIGHALSLVAARDGGPMMLIGTSQTALDEVAAELSRSGVESHALALDLADADAGARIETALAEQGLYCDVLVNSAGFGVFGLAAEADRAQQLRLIDVNIRALTELTLRFLPGMIARRRGGVLNLGSLTAYTPGPMMAAYFASKAYVKSFSLALAAEVAGTGVTVTCFNPGVVRTPFFQRCNVNTRLFKIVPRANADDTAEAGWRAFKAGKRLIVPRFMNRVIAGFCSIVPDSLLLRLVFALQRMR
jgi:short-subunit dehydrogenase